MPPSPARGLMLHFGVNTYHDVEWSDGSLDPTPVNAAAFDANAIANAAANAGLGVIVLTSKHIDGFCLWPTAHSPYSVAASHAPADIIGNLANACAKHHLQLGLYYALWDYHHDAAIGAYPKPRTPATDAADARYADFVLAQLDELLTRYGPLYELWFDGAWIKFQEGFDPAQKYIAQPWKFPGSAADAVRIWHAQVSPRWRWQHIYDKVKSAQPHCRVLNNTTTEFPGAAFGPVDARTGEKATGASIASSSLPLQIETTLSQKGPAGLFESGSWFHHEWDDSQTTPEQLREWTTRAKLLNALLLVNAGITTVGTLRQQDFAALRVLANT